MATIAQVYALLEESELLAKKIPGAQLEILDGGHASAVEQPKALSDFFMKHLTQYVAAWKQAVAVLSLADDQ